MSAIKVVNNYTLESFYRKKLLPASKESIHSDTIIKIARIQNIYPENSNFYLGLKEFRNKYIAHIDQRRLLSHRMNTHRINGDDIKIAYDTINPLLDELIYDYGINPDIIPSEHSYSVPFDLKRIIDAFPSAS